MSIYSPSLREQLQELKEENSEMQNEIDFLVEQRDKAMEISQVRLKYLNQAREFLWREGYYFCVCFEVCWKKKPFRNFICKCEK